MTGHFWVGAREGISADSRVNKVATLNGLWIKSSQPVSKHFLLFIELALIARMGIRLVFSFRRTSLATSEPLMSGRLRSRRITSGALCLICSNASLPELACEG